MKKLLLSLVVTIGVLCFSAVEAESLERNEEPLSQYDTVIDLEWQRTENFYNTWVQHRTYKTITFMNSYWVTHITCLQWEEVPDEPGVYWRKCTYHYDTN